MGNHGGLALRGHPPLDPSTPLRMSGPSSGFTLRRTFGPCRGAGMMGEGGKEGDQPVASTGRGDLRGFQGAVVAEPVGDGAVVELGGVTELGEREEAEGSPGPGAAVSGDIA